MIDDVLAFLSGPHAWMLICGLASAALLLVLANAWRPDAPTAVEVAQITSPPGIVMTAVAPVAHPPVDHGLGPLVIAVQQRLAVARGSGDTAMAERQIRRLQALGFNVEQS